WTAAAPDTSYAFRVTAFNSAGESVASNTATVTTPAMPAAPSGLAATAVGATQVNLTWTDNANNEDGFKVYRSTDGVNWVWFASAGQNATAYNWTSATSATTYSFRVTAFNAVGESAPSNTATATTASAPAAPSNLTASAVSGSDVNLAWADNSANEDGFKLYRSTDGVNWVWFASAGPNATSSTWSGGSPGTTYSFRVSAYNSIGESAASNTATVTTLAPPLAPSSLTAVATAGGTEVNLTWADNANNEDGFKLYRSTDGTNWVWFASAGPNVTGSTWTGAAPG